MNGFVVLWVHMNGFVALWVHMNGFVALWVQITDFVALGPNNWLCCSESHIPKPSTHSSFSIL